MINYENVLNQLNICFGKKYDNPIQSVKYLEKVFNGKPITTKNLYKLVSGLKMDIEIREKDDIKVYYLSRKKESFKRVCLEYKDGSFKAVQRMKPLFVRCHKSMVVKLTDKAEIIEKDKYRVESLTDYHSKKYYLHYTIHECPEDEDIKEWSLRLSIASDELHDENPSLDVMKYGIRQTALHFFTMFNMMIDSPPDITPEEAVFIEGSTRGGIQYHKKGQYEEFITYDINSHYPAIMSSNSLLPYGNPIYKTIDNKYINNKNEIGIYKCKVSRGKCDPNIFQMMKVFENEFTYYVFTDMNMFVKYGCEIEMSSDEFNFMTYDKYIKSETLFKSYVSMFYKLKSKSYLAKEILNSLWGKLCSSSKKTITSKDDKKINIDKFDIDRVEMDNDGEFIYHLKHKVPFKYSWGKLKPFILAYGRQRLMKKVNKNNAKHIIRIHTDSITFNKRLNFKVGKELGEYKKEQINEEGQKLIIHGQNDLMVVNEKEEIISRKGKKGGLML